MCLAVPCRVVERLSDRGETGDEAVVELAGNRRRVSLAFTPEARVGDWVLIHAGVAIQVIDEEEARRTLALYRGPG